MIVVNPETGFRAARLESDLATIDQTIWVLASLVKVPRESMM